MSESLKKDTLVPYKWGIIIWSIEKLFASLSINLVFPQYISQLKELIYRFVRYKYINKFTKSCVFFNRFKHSNLGYPCPVQCRQISIFEISINSAFL